MGRRDEVRVGSIARMGRAAGPGAGWAEGLSELKRQTTAFILKLIELRDGPKRFFYWHLSFGCFNWLVPSASTRCQPVTQAAEGAFVPCPGWELSGCQFIVLVPDPVLLLCL